MPRKPKPRPSYPIYQECSPQARYWIERHAGLSVGPRAPNERELVFKTKYPLASLEQVGWSFIMPMKYCNEHSLRITLRNREIQWNRKFAIVSHKQLGYVEVVRTR